MGAEYKHYSEDYPEVQLILQQTEDQKRKKAAKRAGKSNKFTRELGDIEDKNEPEFDPQSGKLGHKYQKEVEKTSGNLKIKADKKKKKDESMKKTLKTLS